VASKLQLSIICGSKERVAPLLTGEVEVEGVDLIHTKSDPSETFWRQLNFEEFEISEMSMSSYPLSVWREAEPGLHPDLYRLFVRARLHQVQAQDRRPVRAGCSRLLAPWRRAMAVATHDTVRAHTAADYTDFEHTGPGTLAGRFLRLFWQPIHVAEEPKPGWAVPLLFGGEAPRPPQAGSAVHVVLSAPHSGPSEAR
jgi:hypothetical protein